MTTFALISLASAAPPALASHSDDGIEIRVFKVAPVDCEVWEGVVERLNVKRVLDNGKPAMQLELVSPENEGKMIEFVGFDHPAVTGLITEDGKTSTVKVAPQKADKNFGTPAFKGRELRVKWCGATPPTRWKKDPGKEGAWMRVGELWFPVAGARFSKKQGLELSTLPLECDRMVNYMEEAVGMNLQGDPVTFWSTSGTLHPIPMSFNGDTVGSAFKVKDGKVELKGKVDTDSSHWEVRGSMPVVACDTE